MGKMEDFESSLQVLRGFETDISAEVNEIKVTCSNMDQFSCNHVICNVHIDGNFILYVTPENLCLSSNVRECKLYNFYIFLIQRSVASSRRRTTIRFADIKHKRYSVPLMVGNLH